jgi:gliding motility-associated lipoprotein GldD
MIARLKQTKVITLFIMISLFYSCRDVAVPKPRGFFRIDLPKKEYILFSGNQVKSNNMPFTFEYPVYGLLSFNPTDNNEQGWFNIEFPAYKAKIYLTYKDVKNDFENLMDQTYKMNVKNHITKADAINEHIIDNQKENVFGVLYELKGNTASAVQFYATDSVYHYLRGSLYFSSEPNADSLAPVIDFFREDIIHLIETLKWKK